jgi:hypothetical protein
LQWLNGCRTLLSTAQPKLSEKNCTYRSNCDEVEIKMLMWQ